MPLCDCITRGLFSLPSTTAPCPTDIPILLLPIFCGSLDSPVTLIGTAEANSRPFGGGGTMSLSPTSSVWFPGCQSYVDWDPYLDVSGSLLGAGCLAP